MKYLQPQLYMWSACRYVLAGNTATPSCDVAAPDIGNVDTTAFYTVSMPENTYLRAFSIPAVEENDKNEQLLNINSQSTPTADSDTQQYLYAQFIEQIQAERLAMNLPASLCDYDDVQTTLDIHTMCLSPRVSEDSHNNNPSFKEAVADIQARVKDYYAPPLAMSIDELLIIRAQSALKGNKARESCSKLLLTHRDYINHLKSMHAEHGSGPSGEWAAGGEFNYVEAKQQRSRHLTAGFILQLLTSNLGSHICNYMLNDMGHIPPDDAAMLVCHMLSPQNVAIFPEFISRLYKLMCGDSTTPELLQKHHHAVIDAIPAAVARLYTGEKAAAHIPIFEALLHALRPHILRFTTTEALFPAFMAGEAAPLTATFWHAAAILAALKMSVVTRAPSQKVCASTSSSHAQRRTASSPVQDGVALCPAAYDLASLFPHPITHTASLACWLTILPMLEEQLPPLLFYAFLIVRTPPAYVVATLRSNRTNAESRQLLITYWLALEMVQANCILKQLDVVSRLIGCKYMYFFLTKLPVRLLARVPREALVALCQQLVLYRYQFVEIDVDNGAVHDAAASISQDTAQSLGASQSPTSADEKASSEEASPGLAARVCDKMMTLLWKLLVLLPSTDELDVSKLSQLLYTHAAIHGLGLLLHDIAEEEPTTYLLSRATYLFYDSNAHRELLRIFGQPLSELERQWAAMATQVQRDSCFTGKTHQSASASRNRAAQPNRRCTHDIPICSFTDCKQYLQPLQPFFFEHVLPQSVTIICRNMHTLAHSRMLEMAGLLLDVEWFGKSMSLMATVLPTALAYCATVGVRAALPVASATEAAAPAMSPLDYFLATALLSAGAPSQSELCYPISWLSLRTYTTILMAINKLALTVLSDTDYTQKTFTSTLQMRQLFERLIRFDVLGLFTCVSRGVTRGVLTYDDEGCDSTAFFAAYPAATLTKALKTLCYHYLYDLQISNEATLGTWIAIFRWVVNLPHMQVYFAAFASHVQNESAALRLEQCTSSAPAAMPVPVPATTESAADDANDIYSTLARVHHAGQVVQAAIAEKAALPDNQTRAEQHRIANNITLVIDKAIDALQRLLILLGDDDEGQRQRAKAFSGFNVHCRKRTNQNAKKRYAWMASGDVKKQRVIRHSVWLPETRRRANGHILQKRKNIVNKIPSAVSQQPQRKKTN